MLNLNTLIFSIILSIFMLSSCKTDSSKSAMDGVEEQALKYALTAFSSSPSYPDANISDMTYGDGKVGFNVTGYDLGAQTADAPSKMCANSAKGQHIHLIVNDDPYIAKYEANFDQVLADGDHHILSFLSRSYHESIKTASAHLAQNVSIKEGAISDKSDIDNAMVFYSRPKGTYIGKKDTEKVMLDFYLVNTSISATGNYVEANINGESHKLTTWQPYYIEGLPMGENTVELTLRNSAGEIVDAPLNPVKRVFTLKTDPVEG